MEVTHLNYVHTDELAEFMSEATYDAVFEAVRKYVPIKARVLDVGSGRGELLKRFSEVGYEIQGCDMDDRCVKLGARYGKVQKLDIEEIEPDKFGGRFDCVVLSHVLEHVEHPKEALMRVASMSRGILVVSIPNPHFLPFIFKSLLRMDVEYVNTGHLYSWDWSHFKTFVEIGCGHKIVEWFYDSVALPLPGPIRRALNRTGLLYSIERKLLPALTPRFCRSITAVIMIEPPGTQDRLQREEPAV
jgi:2-polyprenyl-3-methyl-5-hydroxy-6-metoxy-1,4-benzoquinol methylase